MTTEPMPEVSSSPLAVQSVMTLSVRVRVTDTSPMPLAVPVKLPDTPLAALVEDALPPHAVRNIAPARSSEARTFFFFMDTSP